MPAARAAGISAAKTLTTTRTAEAAISTDISRVCTPNRTLVSALMNAIAPRNPAAMPTQANLAALATAERSMEAGEAPDAIRTPISQMRRATE